jgi:two-component sensor histidine kinase
VTSRHQAEQERALLAREVDHRAKNILAVVQAALRLTPRDDPRAYAEAVEGRIGALARTHALLARERWTRAGLREIVETELLGFLHGQRGASDGPRARLRGPALLLGPDAAQPLAMAIHELATNATKYGALALSGGHLAVSWTLENRGGMLVLRWVERGGPPLESPPARRGFGSRVLETTVRTQLGGTLTLDWAREGLTCEIRVPTARLLAS